MMFGRATVARHRKRSPPRRVHRLAQQILVAGIVVAVVGAALAASAAGHSGGGGASSPNAALRMVIKYYEGIPTEGNAPPNGSGQSPSLTADRAVPYDDAATKKHPKAGNCTIGWGHLVYYPGHPCSGGESSWTFQEANTNLDTDIEARLKPLNDCIHVALTPGEVRALVGFLFQVGNGLIVRNKPERNPKTHKIIRLIPCQGKLAVALNSGKQPTLQVIVDYINKYQPASRYGARGAYEIWDAGGTGGQPRPAIWKIATAIEPKGAIGTITVTPTGIYDPLVGLSPDDTSQMCASTDGTNHAPEKKCGPFYIDEGVLVSASTGNPAWHFVRWKYLDDGTGDTRDLCADEDATDATCALNVQDQLVRAVAEFAKCTFGDSESEADTTAATPSVIYGATFVVDGAHYADVNDPDYPGYSFTATLGWNISWGCTTAPGQLELPLTNVTSSCVTAATCASWAASPANISGSGSYTETLSGGAPCTERLSLGTLSDIYDSEIEVVSASGSGSARTWTLRVMADPSQSGWAGAGICEPFPWGDTNDQYRDSEGGHLFEALVTLHADDKTGLQTQTFKVRPNHATGVSPGGGLTETWPNGGTVTLTGYW